MKEQFKEAEVELIEFSDELATGDVIVTSTQQTGAAESYDTGDGPEL